MAGRGHLLLLALATFILSTSAQLLVSCDFESEFCSSLVNDPTTQAFTRNSGGTTSEQTGPDSGANNSTFYVYFETSSLPDYVVARLMTYSLNTTGTICVSFNYHMYGRDVNLLALKLRLSGGQFTSDLWSQQGNQGNVWYSFQNEYRVDNYLERLVFEATRGNGYQGDIALDNIMVWKGSCGQNPGTSSSGTTRGTTQAAGTTRPPVATTRSPDIVEGCSLVWQCNFMNDFNDSCGIEQSVTDDEQWMRVKGETSSTNTGPVSGYQGSEDYYFYLEATGVDDGNKAVFYSPYLQARCGQVEFYYNMYGETMGTLEVAVVYGSERDVFFTASGDQGALWKKFSQKLSSVPDGAFRLEFTAIKGISYRSDIAVDEIKFCDCSFQAQTTTTTPVYTSTLPPSGDNVLVQPNHVWSCPENPGQARCTVYNTANLPFTWNNIKWYSPQGQLVDNIPGIKVDTSYSMEGSGYWTSTMTVDSSHYGLSGYYTCQVNYNNRLSSQGTNIAVQGCPRGEFTCADMSGCIPCQYVCDDFDDCGDYSDEFKCGTDDSPELKDRNCS